MKLSRRLVGTAIFFSMGAPLLANPTGADVVKGAAKLNGKGGILNVVTASKNTVINC